MIACHSIKETFCGDILSNLKGLGMRSESGQKETPGPLNRKRSRKGSRGQQGQADTNVLSGQIHFPNTKREDLP